MATGLKFESVAGTAAQVDLSNAKIVVYEDGNGNKYTLDASSIAGLTSINDIKLSTLKDVVFKYQLKGDISETTTTGLGSIIGALFATQSIPNGPSVLAEKAVVEAIFDAKDGDDKISETKIGATFAKKIDLDNKVNVIGDNATDPGVTVMLGKLIGNNQVVKANGSNATEDGAKAILGQLKGNDQVAKINGSNVTEAGVTAMLGKLKGGNQVVKANGDNATEAGVTTMLGKLTDKVVKTSELPTKAAKKEVVEAIFDAKDGDDKISETKIGATFAKKIDLDNKVNVIGDNATDPGVTVMLGKLIGNNQVVKANGSNVTEDGAKAILGQLKGNDQVAKINGSNVTEDGAKAILGQLKGNDQVAKIDGSNVEEDGVIAMLGKLIGNNQVVKANGDNATEAGVTAMLGKLTGDNVVVKINASNLTGAANQQAFAEAILSVKDVNKSILVAKLEGFLAENAKAYSNNTKTAKELLVPSAADLVQDHDFKQGIEKSIKEMAVSSNSDFQKTVREVMSQTSFEIPTSDDAALNWTW